MAPDQLAGMRRLLNGKPISALGFGCSSLWAKPRFDADVAHDILLAADAAGINHFDTSPSYADGEVRLARFLKGRDLGRYVISTKVGTHQNADGSLWRSFAIDDMRRSFDSSLSRLGVEKVDILYLHGPALDDMSRPVLDFLLEQKARGRADHIGINSFDPPVVQAALDLPLDAVMLQYSVADLRFERLIRQLHAKGTMVMAGTILAQSIFDPRTFMPTNLNSLWYFLRAFKNGPTFPFKGMALARKMKRLDMTPHEAALRFAVGHPLVTSCLFGTTRAAHVVANAAAASRPLTKEQRAMLGSRIPEAPQRY